MRFVFLLWSAAASIARRRFLMIEVSLKFVLHIYGISFEAGKCVYK